MNQISFMFEFRRQTPIIIMIMPEVVWDFVQNLV